MRIIDLSVMVEERSAEPCPPVYKRILHKNGAKTFCRRVHFSKSKTLKQKIISIIKFLQGKQILKPSHFPQGEFLSNEIVTIATHTGTHLDAPFHYGPTCNGKTSRTIDDIPLELCYGNGVVLDCTGKEPGSYISKNDIITALNDINYALKEKDIVLIRTDSDKKWGTSAYFTEHPGMSREAVKYLVDAGIKVMGIDAYGFDRSFKSMIGEFIRTKDKSVLWPAHFYGREQEYFHMERLTNLDKIPYPSGFTVVCFPIKLHMSGAAWTRAVAIVQ